MNGEMALQGPSRYPLAWWTHSCCLQREPTAARSGVRRALEEGTTKCAQTTEYQGHGPARGQESRVVSALCTTSKPYVLVRRVSDDKATSRVPPGTPRDEEIRGWSLQARLRAREGGPKSIEVLWVLEVDSDRRRRPGGPGNALFWFSREGFWRSQISRTGGVTFDFFRLLFRAPGARTPGEVSSWVPPCIMGATFAPLPAEGPETYARERNPGRGSATGSRKVVPPAGPSHLTPSSPGEAKSRSREAPRCPHQF